jgi:hypothetical protein
MGSVNIPRAKPRAYWLCRGVALPGLSRRIGPRRYNLPASSIRPAVGQALDPDLVPPGRTNVHGAFVPTVSFTVPRGDTGHNANVGTPVTEGA